MCPVTSKPLAPTRVSSPGLNQHPAIGTTLAGRYLVQRLIGTGGSGEVFEAENVMLRRTVAVKVVRSSASPQAIERLKREAQLLAAVQHPNICDVYDVGLTPDGMPFVVFERLVGETLGAALQRAGRFTLDVATDLFSQLLSGLHAAHAEHLVHRDLKPQNIFLADRIGLPPILKILDFGLAKDLSGSRGPTISRPGRALGTPHYMSPEQLFADQVDRRADLFTTGVMLFEALAGYHPFYAPTMQELQANVLRAAPHSLLAARPDLPPAIEQVIFRALEKNPEHRFSSAVSMQEALARAAGGGAPGAQYSRRR